jgi:hypothetical protein
LIFKLLLFCGSLKTKTKTNWFLFLMKRWDWKKRGRNENDVKHGWHAISFEKDTLWSLNFKNHVKYIILVPQYFSIQFWYKSSFLLFFCSWLREEKEKGCRILVAEREKYRWYWFRPSKQIDYICVKWLHLMREIHIKCFCTFKVREKNKFELRLIFGFRLISVLGAVFWVFVGHK